MTPDQLSTIETYDRAAKRYDETIAKLPNYDESYEYLAQTLADGDRVLELACGTAQISEYISKRKQISVTGFDLSEEMLAIARKRIPDGTFESRSIIDFSVNEKFDAVISGFGIPYLDDAQTVQCLTRAHAALRDGGLLYLSFMHGDSSGTETPSFCPDGSIYVYYHRESFIRGELERIGFDIIRQWEIPYSEPDGSITKDIVMAGKKVR